MLDRSGYSNFTEYSMSNQDEEKKKLERQIRRQNLSVLAIGIVMIVIYVIVAYIYREWRFPLPSPFP
jgi:archaellum biogenesis protein FlaJ (TadC family)